MDEIKNEKQKKSVIREYSEALLTAAIIALFIRAFVIEAFKIPSGSMIPTLSIGDHIFVNKFIYGLRIPFTKYKIINVREPKRGEIIVFIYPIEPDKDFIKRVVGLPGDKITISDNNIQINDKIVQKNKISVFQDPYNKRILNSKQSQYKKIPYVPGFNQYDFFEEKIGEINHIVQYEKNAWRSTYNITVPDDMLFVMGDNRDNSADSREWGFVPMENVKGKAMFVWLSIDKDQGGLRWNEFGRWLK